MEREKEALYLNTKIIDSLKNIVYHLEILVKRFSEIHFRGFLSRFQVIFISKSYNGHNNSFSIYL